MTSHWAVSLQGKPWIAGKSGPDSFDCWGLVRYVQKVHFERETPEIGVDAVDRFDRSAVSEMFKNSEELKNWEVVTFQPAEGDVILLSHSKEPIHIGVVIKPNGLTGVLHCVRKVGVIFTSIQDLGISGWHSQRIYRWKGCTH
jgi:cell wall-associated NlpC family hydrolase